MCIILDIVWPCLVLTADDTQLMHIILHIRILVLK